MANYMHCLVNAGMEGDVFVQRAMRVEKGAELPYSDEQVVFQGTFEEMAIHIRDHFRGVNEDREVVKIIADHDSYDVDEREYLEESPNLPERRTDIGAPRSYVRDTFLDWLRKNKKRFYLPAVGGVIYTPERDRVILFKDTRDGRHHLLHRDIGKWPTQREAKITSRDKPDTRRKKLDAALGRKETMALRKEFQERSRLKRALGDIQRTEARARLMYPLPERMANGVKGRIVRYYTAEFRGDKVELASKAIDVAFTRPHEAAGMIPDDEAEHLSLILPRLGI